MTALQNAQLQMFAAVKAICDANNAFWTDFVPFAATYTDFTDALGAVDAKLVLQNTATEGTTQSKEALREQLEAIVRQVSDCLVLYGSLNQLTLVEDAHIAPSILKKMSAKALIGHALTLKEMTTGITTPPLTSVNLTTNDITALTNATTAFAGVIGKPRQKRVESKRGTKQLAESIDHIMEVLKTLDQSANVLQYTAPDFHTEYVAAREIIDPGYNTRSLSVKITATDTGGGIEGVSAIINPGNIEKIS